MLLSSAGFVNHYRTGFLIRRLLDAEKCETVDWAFAGLTQK
jgi:hypothetical protein